MTRARSSGQVSLWLLTSCLIFQVGRPMDADGFSPVVLLLDLTGLAPVDSKLLSDSIARKKKSTQGLEADEKCQEFLFSLC